MKKIISVFRIVSIVSIVLTTGVLHAGSKLISEPKARPGRNVVAQKLRKCDFLLNKKFKKNAKFYLCLFSASWCGPCRAEMPRIAKAYAETLKDDPDIELIHFSRDQNDDKARAWAKEHNVKFPVVKPKGGNPLDLHSRGIPHLFIVKADGTLVEEGHPMKIFNEEKFREIKSGNVKPRTIDANLKKEERTEKINGYTWSYRVSNGEAEIVAEKGGKFSCAVSPDPTGDVVIPSTLGGAKVTSIGQCAFYQCRGLTSVSIPLSVTNIGKTAFGSCSGMKSLMIPPSVKSIGDEAFWWSRDGLQSVTISEGVTSIGDFAFYADWKLTSVEIPASVVHIGKCAFGHGKITFGNCEGLEAIRVAEGNRVYSSLDGILYNKARTELIQCPAGRMEPVTIPSSVTNIGARAFSDCSGLTSVKIPSSVMSIGDIAFSHCNRISDFVVAEENKAYCSLDGILYNKARTELIQCPCGKKGVVAIPPSVTKIGWCAFSYCNGITSVTIPLSVTSIEQGAFSSCPWLTSLTIPSCVTNIGAMAFQYCGRLRSVAISASVKNIGGGAFLGCRELESVVMLGECPKTYTYNRIFSKCAKLKAIHVPVNAKSWAGMKEWQGIPLVFDSPDTLEALSQAALAQEAKAEAEMAQLKAIQEKFKAKLTGVAIIEGGRMCGYESRALKADFQSPDRPIEIPYGKAACFRIEYDFPEGYQARVWTRDRWQKGEDGSSYYFGSNPSPLYKGKGIAYGFLDMLERGKSCTLKQLVISTNAEPKLDGLSKGWDIVVTPVDIKFHGPEAAQKTDVEKNGCTASCANNKSTAKKVVVADALQSCDFLLNKDFKKNAKLYLCLFSASWCGPCRRVMPRIAQTYAETLKNDPDIELVHFSCDQDDDKAMAWAKEHNVKFPVVKPNGGNPLDLHTSGIPRLFIVKADGTLVEEGHPMSLFTEEKLRELKGGGMAVGAKPQDDKGSSLVAEGVTNVTTKGGLFTLTGPYGIRMTADPGCEKGAEYVMKRLVEHYLPRAKEFYGDPFLGEKPSRVYRIDVGRNDGLGNSQYTGPSYRPGTGSWSIGLSKGANRYEMSLDYLASSVLTLCEEPNWASFVFYVNRFVEAKAKGIDATPRLKEDIRRGLEEDDEDGKNKWYRSHAPLWAALEDLREKHPKLILDYCTRKNKQFAEGKLPKKLSLDQVAALLGEVTGEDVAAVFTKYGVKERARR